MTYYIDLAIGSILFFDADSLDCVKKNREYFYNHNGKGLDPIYNNNSLRLERQRLYQRAGGVHVINMDSFREKKKIFNGRIGHILIDDISSLSISSYEASISIDAIAKHYNI